MKRGKNKILTPPAGGTGFRLLPWLAAALLMCGVILGENALLRRAYWNRCLECVGAAADAGMEDSVLDAFVRRADKTTREKGEKILARSGYGDAMRRDWQGKGVLPAAEWVCCAGILGLLAACGGISRSRRNQIREDITGLRARMLQYVYGEEETDTAEQTPEGKQLAAAWDKVRHGMESQKNALTSARVQMGQFLENISHQLKTPLTAVLLQLDLLLETVPGDSAREPLMVCYRQSLRIQQMVRVLLNLARLDSGKVVFRFRREDMQALVAGCMEEIRPLAEEKNVILSLQTESRDPEEYYYVCDRFWMKEAIENIGKNAIDYTPEGTEVSFEMYRDGGNLYIGIRDQGKGISESDRERIFERFYQGERGENATYSVGIGLSLAHDIIHRYRGSVSAEPAESGGTVFWIRLPELTGKDKN